MELDRIQSVFLMWFFVVLFVPHFKSFHTLWGKQ